MLLAIQQSPFVFMAFSIYQLSILVYISNTHYKSVARSIYTLSVTCMIQFARKYLQMQVSVKKRL